MFSMYIIVVGAGDIGSPLVEIATKGENEVVVIEHDSDRADRIAREYDCLVLNADAKVKETLLDAGAKRADAIISTTDQDATNIMVSLLAKELEIPSILSVVHNPEHMNIYQQIGVNTMENPSRLIAEYLYRSVQRPSIIDYKRIGERAEVFEIVVGEDAPIAEMTLDQANQEGLLTEDVLIIAIEQSKNKQLTTPRGDTVLQAGDSVTVYSAIGATPEIIDVFGHYKDHHSEDD